jgi:hypothetical protein
VIDIRAPIGDDQRMTTSEIEQHAIRVGSGLDALYVHALSVALGGALAFETDQDWRPMPYLDDLYLRGHKECCRFPLGAGVFRIDEGPVRPLGHGAVLVLEVHEQSAPLERSILCFGELLVDGKAVARFSGKTELWRSIGLDHTASGPALLMGPASYLGLPDVGQPGRRARPSSLACRS